MNTSTTITLNDRFAMFKRTSTNGGGQQQQQPRRGRSRSRSRGRQTQQPASLRGSTRNRKLLDQLEKQHKMRLALKLKNKSILRSRGRTQGQIVRNNVKRATAIKKAVNVRNLRRTNSLTTFVPLNDGPGRNITRGRSRSRSRSRGGGRARSNSRGRQPQTGSITDRLGVRQPPRRMRRSNINQVQQQPQRSRSRPRSRVRLNRNNFANNNNRNGGNQAAPKRSNSVNARLANNGPPQARRRRRLTSNVRNQNTQLNRPLGGRIVKRQPAGGARIPRNQLRQKGNAAFGGNTRRGKIVKRGAGAGTAQGQARGRARNRGPAQAGRGQAQAGRGQAQGAQRRGRSRTRRGNNNRGIFRLKLKVGNFKDL